MYRVEILDKTLTPITQVTNFPKLNGTGDVLEYGDKLSSSGTARFRVGTQDPLFKQYGNILDPYANHIRIYRSSVLVWKGVIISNPSRNSKYVEVKAYTYEYLLSRVLINMDPASTPDTKDNLRTFKSGTLADAVTALINEMKATVGAAHPLYSLQIGTIENPVFPAGYTNSDNANIGGTAWAFSDKFQLTFDFGDTLKTIQALAAYGQCDFEVAITQTGLVFNFRTHIGVDRSGLMFQYGDAGAIENYDSPLDGERMANFIKGISIDLDSNVIKTDQEDSASVVKYGKVMGLAAYNDAYNVNVLKSRLNEELLYASTPQSQINVELNYRAFPMGQYSLGDVITIKITDYVIQLQQARRITAYKISVHATGKETVNLDTTPPDKSHVPQESARLKETGYIGYIAAG